MSPVQIDVDEIDFSDIEAQFAVKEDDYLGSVLIVDHLPMVDSAKLEKLMAVLKKIFGRFGHKLSDDAFHMPMTAQNKSKGFMFIECPSTEVAASIAKQADGYRLDAKHTFSVIKFSDFDKVLATPDTYQPPKPEEFKEKEQLNSWLMDEHARDQFVALAGDDVSVFWNQKADDPEKVHSRQYWTDSYLQWSPMGTYLTTMHKQGVALWGGKSWERIVRFAHPNVKLIDFSPKENYLITWSVESASDKDDNLRIWDIRTGKLLRAFSTPNAKQMDWPMFKWSHDDRFVARSLKDTLHIYDLPQLTLLDQKPVKAENIAQFYWSPNDNYIAYWIPEDDNAPARVTVIDVPGKNILRTKNLFMVSSCSLYWQSQGDYLAVKVDRYTKTKKTNLTNLEVFCLREKEIPIEVFEGLKEKQVQALAWEPEGSRFALIATEGQKTFVGFYKMEGDELTELKLTERKNMTHLYWSPKGHFLVSAGLRGMQGELEFWDVDELQLLVCTEHFQASEVEWDPTGRYLMTGVSFWRYQGENGYVIWDFKGQQLCRKQMDRFKQFLWRPRPPTLLGKEQMKKIRRNLDKYSKEFDVVDARKSGAAAEQASALRQKIRDDWLEWRQKCQERYASERDARAKLRGTPKSPIYSDSEDTEDEDVEEWVEELVDEVITVVD